MAKAELSFAFAPELGSQCEGFVASAAPVWKGKCGDSTTAKLAFLASPEAKNPMARDAAISFINAAAQHSSNYKAVLDHRLVKYLAVQMSDSNDVRLVTTSVNACLGFVEAGPEFQAVAIQDGVLEATIGQLSVRKPHDATEITVLELTLRAIAAMASNKAAESILEKNKAMNQLLDMLQSIKDKPAADKAFIKLRLNGAYALRELLSVPSQQTSFSNHNAGLPLLMEMVNAPVLQIREYGLLGLGRAVADAKIREDVVSKNLPLIDASMAMTQGKVAATALQVLVNVVQHDGAAGRRVLEDTRRFDVVISKLSDAQVMSRLAVNLFILLARTDEGKKAVMANNGVVKLTEVAEKTPEEVQRSILSVVGDLLSDVDVQDSALSIDGYCETVVSFLRPERPSSVKSQAARAILNATLHFDYAREAMIAAEAVSHLAPLLLCQDSNITFNVLGALTNLALSVPTGVNQIAVDPKTLETLQQISKSTAKELVYEASSLLVNLTRSSLGRRRVMKVMNGINFFSAWLDSTDLKLVKQGLKVFQNLSTEGRYRKIITEEQATAKKFIKLAGHSEADIRNQAEIVALHMQFPYEESYDDDDVFDERAEDERLPDIVDLEDDETPPQSPTAASREESRKERELWEKQLREIEEKEQQAEEAKKERERIQKEAAEAKKRAEEEARKEAEAEKKREAARREQEEKERQLMIELEEERKRIAEEELLMKEREEELRRIEWECAQLAAPRQEDVSPEDNEMACTASKSEKQEEVPKKKDEDKVAESPDQDGGNLPPLPAPLQDEQGERLMTEAKESKQRLQKLKEQLEEAESQEARRKKRLIKAERKGDKDDVKKLKARVKKAAAKVETLKKQLIATEKGDFGAADAIARQTTPRTPRTPRTPKIKAKTPRRDRSKSVALTEAAKLRADSVKAEEALKKKQELVRARESALAKIKEEKKRQEAEAKERAKQAEQSRQMEKMAMELIKKKDALIKEGEKAKLEKEVLKKNLEKASVPPGPSTMKRPPNPEEMAKVHGRRTNIAREILDTEKSYVNSLNIIVDKFMNPLLASCDTGKPIITKDEIKDIFSNVSILLNFNNVLLDGVRQRLLRWTEEQKIGDIFLQAVSFLKVYVVFVNNFNTSMETLSNLKSHNEKFAKFIKTVEKSKELNFLTLESFLIMPVQRIPRYVMLLSDLTKRTWEGHPDLPDLTKALGLMKETGALINERKRESENTVKLHQLKAKFKGKFDDLITPSRRFLHEMEFGWIKDAKSSSTTPIMIHLFNDLITFSKPKGERYLDLKGRILLLGMLVAEVDGLSKFPFAFRCVGSPSEKAAAKAVRVEFILNAKSLEEQQESISKICKTQMDTVEKRLSYKRASEKMRGAPLKFNADVK